MAVSGFLFLSLKNSSACMVGYYKNSEKTIKGGGIPQGMLGMFNFFLAGYCCGIKMIRYTIWSPMREGVTLFVS
jgi:hypothetical protein